MRRFKHLSFHDRLKIEDMLKAGAKPKEIAEAIGVHISTIYREVKRGRYEHMDRILGEIEDTYSPDIAHQRYKVSLKAKGGELKIGNDYELATYIEQKIIKDKYSPAAVLGEIQAKGMTFNTSICTSTLYSYIDKGVFLKLTNKHLPIKSTKKRVYRQIRTMHAVSRGDSIEKRPHEVNQRNTFGHWEMDTVFGKRGIKASLLVLTERLSRREIIILLGDRSTSSVVTALDNLERKYKELFSRMFLTITVDNGSEFSDPVGMERSILHGGKRTKIYYCHPYSSWERGSNENQNRMIRRHLPKYTDISNVGKEQIIHIENWINDYPRGIFAFRTSTELFEEQLRSLLASGT